MRDFRDDVAWAVRARLLLDDEGADLVTRHAPTPDGAAAAHNRLIRGREALRLVIQAHVDGSPASPDASAVFERLVAASCSARRFVTDQVPFGWTWEEGDPDAILHRAMLAAADLLADQHHKAIRMCAGDGCGWFFLDTSKAGRRRWCSDASCGSHDRVMRFRDRARPKR